MFDGSSTTTYLDAGKPLPAVMESAATLDELTVTADHLNRAVEDAQMTITHTGRLRLAPGFVLLAVVRPEAEAKIMHRHVAPAEWGPI
jgi:hypothetical protein